MFRLGKIKSITESYLNQYKTANPASYAAAQQAVGGLLIIDGLTGIDNPLGNKKRSGIFGSLIGIFTGLVFIFGTGFAVNLAGINKMTATTTGEVVSVSQPSRSSSKDSEATCTPTAKYTVNDKQYTQTASSGGSNTACSLSVGEKININYDPNRPGAWAYDLATLKTLMNIFPIVGVITVIVSFVIFVIRLLSIIFGWKLLKSGRALAKTLPAGTDLSTIKNEIKQNFAQYLFGMGTSNILSPAPVQNQAPAPVAPVQPSPAPYVQPQPPQPPSPSQNTYPQQNPPQNIASQNNPPAPPPQAPPSN